MLAQQGAELLDRPVQIANPVKSQPEAGPGLDEPGLETHRLAQRQGGRRHLTAGDQRVSLHQTLLRLGLSCVLISLRGASGGGSAPGGRRARGGRGRASALDQGEQREAGGGETHRQLLILAKRLFPKPRRWLLEGIGSSARPAPDNVAPCPGNG